MSRYRVSSSIPNRGERNATARLKSSKGRCKCLSRASNARIGRRGLQGHFSRYLVGNAGGPQYIFKKPYVPTGTQQYCRILPFESRGAFPMLVRSSLVESPDWQAIRFQLDQPIGNYPDLILLQFDPGRFRIQFLHNVQFHRGSLVVQGSYIGG